MRLDYDNGIYSGKGRKQIHTAKEYKRNSRETIGLLDCKGRM